MSEEPKKKIEELLEASAKARRAQFGADAKMPNPMRAQLHDEIARMSDASEAETHTNWFAAWWPRLAIGAAVALLLVGTPIWLSRHNSESTIQVAADTRNMPLSPPVPAAISNSMTTESAGALGLSGSNTFDGMSVTAALSNSGMIVGSGTPSPSSRSDGKAPKDEELAFSYKIATDVDKLDRKPAEMPVTTVPAPVSQPWSETGALAKAESADTSFARGREVQTQAEPKKPALQKFADVRIVQAAPAQAPAGMAGSLGKDAASQQTALNFRQVFRMNVKVKQPVNVLQSFQVEQTANQIRLIDADGSTYTGRMELIAAKTAEAAKTQNKDFTKAAAGERRGSSVLEKESQSQGAEFRFRATGSNLSLKKLVVFEGSYIAASPDQAAKGGREELKKNEQAQTQQQQLPARILGVAKINGESEVEVDAVSVEP